MNHFYNYIQCLAVISCVALSACTGGILKAEKRKTPAPIIQYGASAGYGSRGVHTVLPNETLAVIGRYYNLNPKAIASANNMSITDRLTSGMRLTLPPPKTYRVRTGDTPTSISKIFDIAPEKITSIYGNRLKTGDDIQLDRLIDRLYPVVAGAPRPVRTSPVPYLTAPVEDIIKTQATFHNEPNGITVASLGPVAMNNTAPTPITPGQKPLYISRFGANSPRASGSSIVPDIAPGPTGRYGFSRPLNGPVLSSYGPKSGGLYNEGINLAAPRGTPVRAASTGKVVYVGNAVQGYGNLILLKHDNGYITTYAHLDKALVRDGQIVQQGQTIGTVGSTGNVKRAQLHFEIRKGRDSINPMTIL